VPTTSRPKLAVWKFASCDGCQLSLLDCEDELLTLAAAVEIANFPEASRAVVRGPYDISLVEGSITTPHDAERIHQIRRSSKLLVTIGACATAGGIQALRNFADVREWVPMVYASPASIETLSTSTPIANHVSVDFELHGCPIDKHQLVGTLLALLNGRRPVLPSHSVCTDCKRRGTVCVAVSDGLPCLGPVTRTGCDAICPSYRRGCYGCFGPLKGANVTALAAQLKAGGLGDDDIVRLLRTYNAGAEPFRKASESHERHSKQ
jgi:sulfhydrogenase subunit delta